ncbi:MAG TPA: HD domain-containing phosphohydrolase [Candidatus Xenobia bacterium]|nr:HD domain-containing phosphohydrolase [Candidatus Xenobia bacterium]
MNRKVVYFSDSPAATQAKALPAAYAAQAVGRGPLPAELRNGPLVWLADWRQDARDLERALESGRAQRVIYFTGAGLPPQPNGPVFAYLPPSTPAEVVERTLAAAFENLELAERLAEAERTCEALSHEIAELNRIGIALSAERDTQKLLELILRASREITAADAGSLYLVEEVAEGQKRLRFKLTQNDSIELGLTEFTMPIDRRSIAGYVADTGEVVHLEDVYNIPADRGFKFNRRFDEEIGYRTKSMLTIPMKNQKGEILGVVQLINRKRDFAAKLISPAAVDEQVVPFEPRVQELAFSLASQAAVAYENNVLYESIQTLFEGFVKAAVTAIEQRDPTTSGHSFRVSKLTCGLAEVVDRVETGPYAGLRFSREQMKEIRYAALLHDFGKVGVREQVLVKAKKLYPHQIQVIQQRFDFVRKAVEADYLRRKLEAVQGRLPAETLNEIEMDYQRRLQELEDYWQFLLQVNEPTVLPEGRFERLLEIAKRTYLDVHGVERNYLTPEEVRFLSIPKGSLDPEERLQIESHVIHTFNFLAQIPWTSEIKNIPLIARAHHEKLDGTGYPYKLKEPQIPPQTKMMTISDIFDALSAADRPYKKAVPIEKALDILADDVRRGGLDPVLFQLFVDAKVYQLTAKGS